jgi:hypothetical protein
MSLVGHKGGMTDGRSASDDNTSGLLALCCPRNVYRYDLRERAARETPSSIQTIAITTSAAAFSGAAVVYF